jgi:L-threonylcarbamoyladenylate synthase
MSVVRFMSDDDVAAGLPRVRAHFENGGLLAYPTETVYGLGSRLKDADLAALGKLTDRPPGKPYLVLVAGEEMARECGLSFTEAAARLAGKFWPGPLTLVLSAEESDLPDALRGSNGGIAIRWSSHPFVNELLEGLGFPISSTSANRSGREPLPDIDAISMEFAEAVQSAKLLLLDGGRLKGSSPSTLVDCTGVKPRILREGAITRAHLDACVGEDCC